MKKIVSYEHHGKEVSVREDLKGKHREYCLCYDCPNFKLENEEKCPIAAAVYENCKKFNLVTPVWECPACPTDEERR